MSLKPIVTDKTWDYFHSNDQNIWSSVTFKFQQCITIKNIEYSRNDIVASMM